MTKMRSTRTPVCASPACASRALFPAYSCSPVPSLTHPPLNLVLPLRPCLHSGELHLDGSLQRLVVADLEVQTRDVQAPVAPPVAPVERVRSDQIEGARDEPLIPCGGKERPGSRAVGTHGLSVRCSLRMEQRSS